MGQCSDKIAPEVVDVLDADVAAGTFFPAPDDEDVPPQITLRFRCRSQERCS